MVAGAFIAKHAVDRGAAPGGERAAVDEVEIEIPVAVEIGEGDASTVGLRQHFFVGGAVDMLKEHAH